MMATTLTPLLVRLLELLRAPHSLMHAQLVTPSLPRCAVHRTYNDTRAELMLYQK